MANKHLLQILQKGAQAWNEWRREKDRRQQNVYLDLRKADLRGARLEGVDLSVADLRGADLSEADLYRANLRGANFSGANLSGADLHRADLYRTILVDANLIGAKLPFDYKPEEPKAPTRMKPEARIAQRHANRIARWQARQAASTESTGAGGSQQVASLARSETVAVHDTSMDMPAVQDVHLTEMGETKAPSETQFPIPKDASSEVMRPTSVADDYLEGGRKERLSRYFDRDPKLRAAAIALHGTTCMVCGFNFEAVYGAHGAGYVEVHHLRPVSTLISRTKVDPMTDMVVLCANCHRMVHRNKERMLSPDELRGILKR